MGAQKKAEGGAGCRPAVGSILNLSRLNCWGKLYFLFPTPPLIVHVRLGIRARDGGNCKTYRVIFFVFLSCFLLLGGNGSGDHSNLTKLFYWVEASGKLLPGRSLHRLPLSNSGTEILGEVMDGCWILDPGFRYPRLYR